MAISDQSAAPIRDRARLRESKFYFHQRGISYVVGRARKARRMCSVRIFLARLGTGDGGARVRRRTPRAKFYFFGFRSWSLFFTPNAHLGRPFSSPLMIWSAITTPPCLPDSRASSGVKISACAQKSTSNLSFAARTNQTVGR